MLTSISGRRFLRDRRRRIDYLRTPRHFASFVNGGNDSPGVLLVIPRDAPLRSVAETLVLIQADNTSEDWRNAITTRQRHQCPTGPLPGAAACSGMANFASSIGTFWRASCI